MQKQPQHTTNKMPSSNKWDVEIAKIQAEESVALKNIELEIGRSNGRWNAFKVIGSVITGAFSLLGVIIPAFLSWKGDLKLNITMPESYFWYFIVAIAAIEFVAIVILIFSWRLERNGKKRAIIEKQKFQKIAESSDTYRSSSCLTERGDTSKERK